MSDPLLTAEDLGTYLNDDSLNPDRAEMLIGFAQDLCETVLSPLPDTARGIVARVAHRAYVSIVSARRYQTEMADSGYGGEPGAIGGVYLTSQDRADLLALDSDDSNDGQPFTIHTGYGTYRQAGC